MNSRRLEIGSGVSIHSASGPQSQHTHTSRLVDDSNPIISRRSFDSSSLFQHVISSSVAVWSSVYRCGGTQGVALIGRGRAVVPLDFEQLCGAVLATQRRRHHMSDNTTRDSAHLSGNRETGRIDPDRRDLARAIRSVWGGPADARWRRAIVAGQRMVRTEEIVLQQDHSARIFDDCALVG